MENDSSSRKTENLICINKYFKLDFPGQTIKGNKNFKEFKNLKLKELGKDAKLFHCKRDNIYFYVTKAECKKGRLYLKQCPLCYNYICYFCERKTKKQIDDFLVGDCCVKSKIYNLLFYSGPGNLGSDYETYIWILTLIPLVNLFILISILPNLLFFRMKTKNKNSPDNLEDFDEQKTYLELLQQNGHFNLILPLFFLTYILYDFCFFIIFYCITIFVYIIGLFTKFYPIKYLFGIIGGGM